MKICSSSRLPLPPRPHPCKAHSTTAFSLLPSSHLSYHFQQPLRSGRHQPKSFLCSRFPQTHRPPSSGGWIRHKCRQTSVKTTRSGYAFTWTFAPWEQEYRYLEGAILLRNYSRKTLSAYRLWVAKVEFWTPSNDLAQSRRREPSAAEVPRY